MQTVFGPVPPTEPPRPTPFPEPAPADPLPSAPDPTPIDRPPPATPSGRLRERRRIIRDDLERAQQDRAPLSLGALLAVDHLRINNLIDELARATDTPGVRSDLVAQLRRDVDRHMTCVERVVHLEVQAELGEAEADIVAASRMLMARVLDIVGPERAAPGNVDHLRLAFERHVEAERLLVDRLEREVGRSRLARMGADYSALNDAAPQRGARSRPPRPVVPLRRR
jgi:hypothetical protein